MRIDHTFRTLLLGYTLSRDTFLCACIPKLDFPTTASVVRLVVGTEYLENKALYEKIQHASKRTLEHSSPFVAPFDIISSVLLAPAGCQ